MAAKASSWFWEVSRHWLCSYAAMLVISGINELQETWIVGHFFSSFSRKSCRGWPWQKAMEAEMQKNSPVETLKVRWKDRCVRGPAYQEKLCHKVVRKSLSSIEKRNTYGDLVGVSHTAPVPSACAFHAWHVDNSISSPWKPWFRHAFIDFRCFSQNSGDYDYRAVEFVATTATRSSFSQGLHEAF